MQNLEYLIKSLGDYVRRYEIKARSKLMITELVHLPTPIDKLSAKQAVVGNADEIKELAKTGYDLNNITFFIAGGDDLEFPADIKCNLVFTSLDILSICKILDGIMRQYFSWDIRILQAVVNSNSPISVLAECVSISGMPFFLLNDKYEVMDNGGYNLTSNDPVVEEALKTSKLTYDSLQTVKGSINYILNEIKVARGRVYYLITTVDRNNAIDIKTLAFMAAYTLKKILKRRDDKDHLELFQLDKLIEEVLDGSLTDNHEIGHRIACIIGNNQNGKWYSCMVIRMEKPEKREIIRHIIKRELPNALISVFKEEIIVIDIYTGQPENDFIVPPAIEEAAGKYDFRGCYHYYFHDFSFLRTNYLLAVDALRLDKLLRQVDKKVFKYEAYSMYNIMDILTEKYMEKYSNGDLVYIVHPVVYLLCLYDRTHDSSLRKTLEQYLRTNRSVEETAKKLFVHKNTVIYRLKKIKTITGIDIEDDDLRFNLRFSCMLIGFLEKFYGMNLAENFDQ